MAEENDKKIWNVKRGKGHQWIPAYCRSPEECIDCYVVKLYDGNTSYCGNPRMFLRYKAMIEKPKGVKEMEQTKPFVEKGLLYVPRGARLKCQKCQWSWTSTKARKPSTKTGIRCPKCHSRDVINADGSEILPKKERKGHKVKMERDKEPSKREGEEVGFRRTKKPKVSKEKARAIDELKSRVKREAPPPAEGVPPTEEALPEEELPAIRDMSELLTPEEIGELFDPETFEMLHELEVEALCRKLKKPRYKSYERAIKSLSKKSSMILKLVFRHPDISLGLKILIGLYILQQITLIGAIFAGTEIGYKPIEEGAEPEAEEEE